MLLLYYSYCAVLVVPLFVAAAAAAAAAASIPPSQAMQQQGAGFACRMCTIQTSKQRTNTQNHTYVVLVYVLSVHRFHTKQYAVVFPTGVQFWLYKIRQKILLLEIRFIICTYVQDISNSISIKIHVNNKKVEK